MIEPCGYVLFIAGNNVFVLNQYRSAKLFIYTFNIRGNKSGQNRNNIPVRIINCAIYTYIFWQNPFILGLHIQLGRPFLLVPLT